METPTKPDGNLPARMTAMPVNEFLRPFRASHLKIAGLLDYGYSVEQIAKMTNIDWNAVRSTIHNRGYRTAEEMWPIEAKK